MIERAEACLRSFLAADGEQLLALYEPLAQVPYGTALLRTVALPRSAYVAARDGRSDGRPRFGALRLTGSLRDGDALLVRGTVRELEDGREVGLVACLRLRFDGARLVWAGLAPEEDGPLAAGPWQPLDGQAPEPGEPGPDAATYARLLRGWVLGEVVSGPDEGADTWLERAYRRCWRHPRPPLLFEPGARFRCDASGRCCSNDMTITLPATAQAMLDALPWEAIAPDAPELHGTQLEPRPEGDLLLKAKGERCRFLHPQGHCRIHAALGRPVFGPCTVFPFSFSQTPDGVVVLATAGCPSARRGFGPPLAERAEEIHQRLYLSTQTTLPRAFSLRADEPVPWEAFQEAEARVLSALDGPGSPAERLLAAAAVLERGEAYHGEATLAGAALGGMLAAFAEAAGLHLPPAGRVAEQPMREVSAVMDLVRTVVFGKRVAYAWDLLTAVNMAALLYVLALYLQAAYPPGPLPQAFWELVGLLPTRGAGFLAFPGQEAGAPVTGSGLRQPGYTAWLLGL